MLLSGILLMGIAMVGFGLFPLIYNNDIGLCYCLFIRVIQGTASSMVQTTAYAIVAISYPDNQQKYLSILEGSTGLGCMIGPLLGANLYTLFGFDYTFHTLGICFILLSPVLYMTIPKCVDDPDEPVIENSELS